jgi:hypothetical protein
MVARSEHMKPSVSQGKRGPYVPEAGDTATGPGSKQHLATHLACNAPVAKIALITQARPIRSVDCDHTGMVSKDWYSPQATLSGGGITGFIVTTYIT